MNVKVARLQQRERGGRKGAQRVGESGGSPGVEKRDDFGLSGLLICRVIAN